MLSKVLFAFFVVLFAKAIVAQVPSGCGGFIQISEDLQKITKKLDYSVIKVKLTTKEGAVKDTTECAPTGYYFLPIYDKGDYLMQIQGPEGWSFEPNQAPVHIGDDNQCTSPNMKGEDINFSLTGFSILGKVTGENCQAAEQNQGPAGVTVHLSATGSDAFISSVQTDTKGAYRFTNIFPGKYKLKATHPNWTLSKMEADIVVSWGNVAVPVDFVVSGYDVTGMVTSKDEPVLGVDFLLYSDTVKHVPCDSAAQIKLPDNRKSPLCTSRSDEHGRFSFNNIPCGSYKLIPYYRGANTTFDVVPAEASFVVSRGSTTIKEPFQVMGFSLTGKVVNGQGKGVKDVLITVNGNEKGSTDSNGYYKLDQLVSGSYNIEAFKEHTNFNSLMNYRVSPNVVSLPDITVKSYHLCGRVHVAQPPSGVSVARQRTMILSSDNDKEIERRTADQSGNFCFEVASGSYKISPVITPEEEAGGLLLNPRTLKVTVNNIPVLDLSFNQARVTISGKVRCIESPCDPSTSVSLYSESSQNRVTTGLGVRGATGREGDSADYFVFRDVFPGVHKVTINKEPWCWEHESFEVEVKTEDITNLEFIQSGYLLTLKVSHDISLFIDLENKEEFKNFSLQKGLNKFCIKRPGIHTLQPKSCYKFEQDTYKYDTASPKIIDLTATHYLVKGTIEATETADITVNINKQTGDNEVVSVLLIANETKKFTYQYSYWSKLGDMITVSPSSSKLLFYPPTRTVSVLKSECPPAVEKFDARPGYFISGSTVPSLAGVTISVYSNDTNEKLKEVLTTADGKYQVGPLYDDKQYRIGAEKEGFKFQQTAGGFKAMKLGSIVVKVQDQDNAPVNGALLSLSGSNYRNNNVTLQGTFSFWSLYPGEYYLKPLLKEYIFEPASQSITIDDGEDKSVNFVAKRTAYSCYGTVKSLNGEPEKLVSIEATGSEGLYEETQSDVNGLFRLRGLLPNQSYKISVKQGEADRIERASPSYVTVVAENRDIHDVEFVVFRKVNKYDLTGIIATEEKWLNSLNVSLYKDSALSTPINSLAMSNSRFFDFSSLAKGKYILKLHTTLSPQMYTFQLPEEVITFDQSTVGSGVHVKLNFTATVNQAGHDVTATPFFGLVFAVILFFSVLNYQTILDFIQTKRQAQVATKKKVVSSPQDAASEWLPASITNKKIQKKSNTKGNNNQ